MVVTEGTMACCVSFLNRAAVRKFSFLVHFSILLFAFKCVVKNSQLIIMIK